MDRNIFRDQHRYFDHISIPSFIGCHNSSLHIVQFLYEKVNDEKNGRGTGTSGIFGSGIGSDKLKYYCMNCGTQHRQAACPKCGSKMKRIGS